MDDILACIHNYHNMIDSTTSRVATLVVVCITSMIRAKRADQIRVWRGRLAILLLIFWNMHSCGNSY